jgi:hypothetical protein
MRDKSMPSPKTPAQAGPSTSSGTLPSVRVTIPGLARFQRQMSFHEPSPASTYGETANDSTLSTPARFDGMSLIIPTSHYISTII